MAQEVAGLIGVDRAADAARDAQLVPLDQARCLLPTMVDILILCTHNSARSVLAEAMLNQ